MVPMRRNRPGRAARRLLAAIAIAVMAGGGALGVALARSGSPGAISLNAPVSFPVDI